MLSDEILPRLRTLARARGFTRAAMCNYLGLHTNTLWRLDDDDWAPRLSTVRRIEDFLNKFERSKRRSLTGEGWRITYRNKRWWIVVRGGTRLGPFDDPDSAVEAGLKIKLPAKPSPSNGKDS